MSPSKDIDGQLTAIAKHLTSLRPNDDADRLLRLTERFYRRMPDSELAEQSVRNLATVLDGMLGFMAQREAGQPKIRLFNPSQAEQGWETSHSVIEIVNDDMPFLVDSVTVCLTEHEVGVHRVVHPVLAVQRDARGNMTAYCEAGAEPTESVMHLHVDRMSDQEQMERIEQALRRTLHEVRLSVHDWQPMLAAASELAESITKDHASVARAASEETSEFLSWLVNDHFTFLGCRDYRMVEEGDTRMLQVVKGSGLGILSEVEEGTSERRVTSLSQGARDLGQAHEPLIVTKTNSRSRIHRVGYMDYIGVLRYDADGRVVGERRFLGLFTSNAYNRSVWDTPLVRRKVAEVMENAGLSRGSHAWKALAHILETLPRDELFQSDSEELSRLSLGILGLQERRRTKLFIREERFGRFFSCMVFIPRDRFNTEVRGRIQAILSEALGGEKLDYVVQVSESVLARLHVIVRPKPDAQVEYDVASIEAQIVTAVRSWHDELEEILVQKLGEEQGLSLARSYAAAFPMSYVEDVSPWVAAFDVENAAVLDGEDDLRMSLYRPRQQRVGMVRFKLFKYTQPIPLSEVLPMLENLGLRIVNERPYEMRLEDGRSLWIQDFDMTLASGENLDIEAVRDRFQEAFEKAFRGETESDGFNRLILLAQLQWRQVTMLRAYCKYLMQSGIPFSQAYMEETLGSYPILTRLLVQLFEAQFDPDRDQSAEDAATVRKRDTARVLDNLSQGHEDSVLQEYLEDVAKACTSDRATEVAAIRRALHRGLESVRSLDQDRILRAFGEGILATLRTSYFQFDEQGEVRSYMSFKLDSNRVPNLPKPKPYREIWVFSPRVEGIHLRMGKVARGGLRWSDRREDFRTEVLGLMKAQNVKNTMIVPLGAKGGFFPKRLPVAGDREQIMAEVVACYKQFINGLLDITDNLVEDELVPPERVVRHDEDDPYLVVAADKGTATFSDLANEQAGKHRFWLGDAFASGGSVGYDHKGVGITAKGAWESVKRHFRELGTDIQNEDFTVVGIGDMAGDVFGNGMLLSRHIRLQAAFNHQHIFLDPNPDAESSFIERERLFRLDRSTWEDYDSKLISKGGGIFSRQAKTIELSEEVREWLGIEEAQLTPSELIRQLLMAPVDLLWNGGIGTYVKASSESNAEVGDLANNPLRVDGREMRCRVVGEGGNLGLTQRGRIEYARNGGLINTDFIDNSAGVDCSDHEVNIKILLNQAIKAGEMDVEQRNRLLADMTGEVEQLVLRSNYLQTQAISMMESLTGPRLGAKAHLIRVMEQNGVLDRDLEFLPDDEELAERRLHNLGLTRPELSILLSYSKIVLYQQLLASDVPEDPYLSRELVGYFPTPLKDSMAGHMERHRLRREIIATMVTNSMVNRMGASFALRMHEDTGATPAQVSRAYTIAREVFRARDFWRAVEGLDNKVSAVIQTEAILVQWNQLRQVTRWLLNQPGQVLEIQPQVERMSGGVDTLQQALSELMTDQDRERLAERARHFSEAGFPEELARHTALLPWMIAAMDIVDEAVRRSLDVKHVARVYFGLGERMNLKWLAAAVESLSVDGQWHAHARGNLRDELYSQQRALTSRVLQEVGAEENPVERWLQQHRDRAARPLEMLSDMRNLPSMDYATVSVAIRGLEQLVLATA